MEDNKGQMGVSGDPVGNSQSAHFLAWKPRPLTPKFDEKKHGNYVKKIIQILLDNQNRNIALTGSYGTGKSSIIDGLNTLITQSKGKNVSSPDLVVGIPNAHIEFLKKLNPIVVSLPTLHQDLSSRSVKELGSAAQATTPTNNVQREIVKHLLYREKPELMRQSNYRRVVPNNKQRQFGTYSVLALVVVFLVMLFQGQLSWDQLFENGMENLFFVALATVVFLVVALIDYLIVYPISIKGLSAGPAKIELEKGSVSYFDQYLDEIIYYFQQSRTNLVIFEDLDRYGNPYIFETLKELNDLVNTALQTSRESALKAEPIRFIFATKDSALITNSTLQPGGGEDGSNGLDAHEINSQVSANERPEDRIKFFDAILPVVPFSTTHNSVQHLYNELFGLAPIGDPLIDRQLLELVGNEISDYRVLNNIVNEFLIYFDELNLSVGENVTGSFLRPTQLFALISYKAIAPQEFERIPAGQSALDKFNLEFRTIHKNLMDALDREQSDLERNIDLNSISDSKAQMLGAYLESYVEAVSSNYAQHSATIQIDGEKFAFKEVFQPKFWTVAIQSARKSGNRFGLNFREYQGAREVEIPEFVVRLITQMISSESIDPLSKSLETTQGELENVLWAKDVVRFARYKELFEVLENPDFIFLEELRTELTQASQKWLPNNLARQLVLNGYIDDEFHLYVSSFLPGLNSASAQSYITRNIRRNLADPSLPLLREAADEVAFQILKSPQYFESRAILNGSLFTALHAQIKKEDDGKIEKLKTVARDLNKDELGEFALEFVHSILRIASSKETQKESPDDAKDLLLFLASVQPQLLSIAISFDGTADRGRLTDNQSVLLLDAVLREIESKPSLAKTLTADFVRKYFQETSVLTRDDTEDEKLELIARHFRESGIDDLELEKLSGATIRYFFEMGVFSFSSENLRLLQEEFKENPTFSFMRKSFFGFRQAVLRSSTYIAALKEIDVPSFDLEEDVVEVLQSISEYKIDRGSLMEILENSMIQHQVNDISLFDDEVSRLLIELDWMACSAENICNLLGRQEGEAKFESDLVSFIYRNRKILPSSDDSLSARVATFILENDIDEYSGLQRFERLHSLSLKSIELSWGQVGELNEEKVIALLEDGLLDDDSESYLALKRVNDSWSVSRAFLSVASAIDWNDPQIFGSGEEVSLLLRSQNLPLDLQQKVLSYVNQGELSVQDHQWFYILLNSDQELKLTITQLRLAVSGLGDLTEFPTTVRKALSHAVELVTDSRTFQEFSDLLDALGAPYSELLEKGYSYIELPNDPLHYQVFQLLKKYGNSVSSTTPEEMDFSMGATFNVNRKRK